MSIYRKLPVDQSRTPMQEFPAALDAIQSFGSSNTAASSVVTLADNAVNLEVTTGANPVALRWVATTDTQASVIAVGASANFDHVVPANATRRFAVPVEGNQVASIVGDGVREGLYRRVAWITAASNSSVYGTTY